MPIGENVDVTLLTRMFPRHSYTLTGKLAGRRGEAAAVQGSPHQHNAHLLCGALEHLHVPVLHRLFVALLGHHERFVGGLHLDEGVARGPTLQR